MKQFKVISGAHLTEQDKQKIKAMIDQNILCGRIGRTDVHIIPQGTNYAVTLVKTERRWIGEEPKPQSTKAVIQYGEIAPVTNGITTKDDHSKVKRAGKVIATIFQPSKERFNIFFPKLGIGFNNRTQAQIDQLLTAYPNVNSPSLF